MSAFMENDESCELFKKAGFQYLGITGYCEKFAYP